MRIEPIIGTDLRTTGRPEPIVSNIQPQIPFLEIEIDHTTNFNDVIQQIQNHVTPFVFEARGASILIQNEGQKSLFLTGLDFMWAFQEDKKAWHDGGVFNG